MNKTVKPPPIPPRPNSSLANLRRLVRRHIDTPNSKENAAKDLESQYRRENLGFGEAQLLVEEFTKRKGIWQAERDRIAQLKEASDPLTIEDKGPLPGGISSFLQAKFILFNTGSALGVVMGIHGLASYVSSADAVPMLYGHYWACLLMSGLPVAGAMFFESRGALAQNESEERSYYKKLSLCAGVALVVWVATVSNVFAPTSVDLSALTQALADGVSPNSWFDAFLKNFANRLALGSQLLTEMLVSAVIAHAAEIIYRGGRRLEVRTSEKQQALDKIITSINQKIDMAMKQLAHAQAELDLHTEAMRGYVEKGQYLLEQVEVELDTNKRRIHDDTISRFEGASR